MFIMNGEVPNIKDALAKIKQNDPEKYINALSRLMQYYIPRKTDITSDNEKLASVVNINVSSDKNSKKLKEFLNERQSD